ncbi:MAG: TonB-dependent receptor, partial [Verrucomicrobia bacterium]
MEKTFHHRRSCRAFLLNQRLVAITILVVDATVSAFAQSDVRTNSLNPVTVTGSRVETASFNAPFSVDVAEVNPAGIAQPGVNVSEVLAGIPGLVVQNRQNYAQDLQISVRGFGARSAFGVRGVKLITDGIPATNPDGQGQAATFNLDTAERIEVLRGPFATIYGNDSGGVIQLFSRDGKGEPRVHAGVVGGSWGAIKVDVGSEGEAGGVGYVLDGSRFETAGFREHSAATRYQEFAKFNFEPDEHSRLTVVASGLQQPETQDPLGLTWATYQTNSQAVEPQALTFNTRKSIEHEQAGATYERRFGDENRLQLLAYGGQRSVVQYLAIPRAP